MLEPPHRRKGAKPFFLPLFFLSLCFWGGTSFVFPQETFSLDGFEKQRADLSPKDLKRVEEVTRPTKDFSRAEKFELMQGGAGTSKKDINKDAFSHPSQNLNFEEEERFKLGNALFRKLWVSSPSSTHASDGLGPFFNARSCQTCHLKDGRGHPPEEDQDATSMFLRLARPAETKEEKNKKDKKFVLNFPDPIYGGQLQDLAVPGLKAEGRMVISYTEAPVYLADGTMVSLRKPHYSIANLAYGALHPKTTLSPRVANPMIGLGLVEAIHPADILALSDPLDANKDGISGKVAFLRDKISGKLLLGRFGWKAQTPSLREQGAKAFAGDIGISTPEVKNAFGDCTQAQKACLSYPTGVQEKLGDTEAPSPVMDLVAFYSRNLAVPARRRVNHPRTLAGKKLFYNSGCASCHVPKFVTRRDAKNAAQAFQLIWPYSDFLLHDMGEGLADGQSVGEATGREWRTPPLWGLGLTEVVSKHTFFLHDGRARNVEEAILWHGGEAEKAKQNYSQLSKKERENLLYFLKSL